MNYENLTENEKAAVEKWWADRNADDYEYQDNQRYARPEHPEQLEEYERRQEGGCCGSVDVLLEVEGGSQLHYGFNYGH